MESTLSGAIDYEALRKTITWDVSKRELGYRDGAPINIADVVIYYAHTTPGAGAKGLSAFVVELKNGSILMTENVR